MQLTPKRYADPGTAGAAPPLCYLTSGEETFWSEPRACWSLGTATGPDPERRLLVLRIDPPAIGQGFGLGGQDIDTVVVTPLNRASSVDPLSLLPLDVHLLLLRTPWPADRTGLGRDDLWLVGRGKLVASRSAAERTDRWMQEANGPRR